MAKDKTQLLRLIFVDKKIREGMRTGKYANCTSMAREYEVSAKSILRDIDYLRYMRGAPIEYDARIKGYYYTEENFQLPAIDISASDLFALYVTEKVLQQHENTPIYSKLRAVFERIQTSLPETVSVEPSWVHDRISILGDHQTAIVHEVWTIIADALQMSRQIVFRYMKPGDKEGKKRTVAPYHLISYQGEWYILGKCQERQTILTFALSRMAQAKLSKKTFTLPNDFDFPKHTQKMFGIFSSDDSFTVTISFDQQSAPYIQERQWHPSQKITVQKDGSLLLTLTVSHLFEIKKWVLSWGGSAEVLAPKELREEILQEVQRMCQRYASTDDHFC